MEINKKIAVVSIGLAIALAFVPLGSVIGAQAGRESATRVSPLYNARLTTNKNEYAATYVGKDEELSIDLPKITEIDPALKQIIRKLKEMNYQELQKLAKRFKDSPNLVQSALKKVQENPALSSLFAKLKEFFNKGDNDLATMACPMPTKSLPTWLCLIWMIVALPVIVLMTMTICLLP